MNVNELADLIGMCGDGGYNQDAAAMLRQQHAEIEALRNQLWDLKSEPWGFNRHPVKDEIDTRSYLIGRYDTSPVKELTDEEIMELWYPLDLHDEAWVEDSVLVNFARAILRKAQEK